MARGGGPLRHRYEELRAVFADPTHRDHRRLAEWVTTGVDAMEFDVTDVNRRLRDR